MKYKVGQKVEVLVSRYNNIPLGMITRIVSTKYMMYQLTNRLTLNFSEGEVKLVSCIQR